MKWKTWLSSVVGAAALVVAGYSSATPINLTDTTYFTATGTNSPEDYVDHGSGAVNWLTTWDYVKWNHHFTFNPEVDTITSAKLTLTFFDDERDQMFNPFTWEFGVGYTDSGDWDIGAINSGDYDFDLNVAGLYDGLFQVTVASLGGDFGIAKSELSITYNPKAAGYPVTEPGTAALMLVGVLGLVIARRNKPEAQG